MAERAVLIMAKQPIAGSSKTRLTPVLTPEDAAELSRCFVSDAAQSMAELADRLPGTIVKVAGSPADSEAYFRKALPHVGFIAQAGQDLGARLDHVISTTLADGVTMVIAINGDSPTLPAALVEDGFRRLSAEDVDVVLGPAEDGGYYLIGWKQPHPRLVKEVTMSTPTVLADTLAIAESLGLSVSLTDPWYDVDLPEDLERLRQEIDAGAHCGPSTSAFFEQRPHLGVAGSNSRSR